MAQREITVLKDVALITCVVQRGAAEPIINAAREAGAQGATVNYGKGMGIRERLGILGVAVEVEKEVIQIIVSTEQVDRVFEKMFQKLDQGNSCPTRKKTCNQFRICILIHVSRSRYLYSGRVYSGYPAETFARTSGGM